ncbi:unnamed protein product, partial [Phaeothamnion confervicola]
SHARLFAVLDGHGESGHLVARRCVSLLPKFMAETGCNPARTCAALHADLAACGVDCSCSGATCVIAVLRGNRLTVANLGDSRCVLGRAAAGGGIAAVPLTSDHKPDRPDERSRIVAMGGQVGSRQLLVGTGTGGAVRVPVGPARVWYQARGETMGLAMSRSLGDAVAHRAGVSAEPEVTERLIDEHDRFLLLATDGVWDVLDVGQAVQIVHGCAARAAAAAAAAGGGNGGGYGGDGGEAASMVCHTARKKWEAASAMVDDITCCVVRL